MKKGRGKRVKRAFNEATFSQYHWKMGGMDTFLGGMLKITFSKHKLIKISMTHMYITQKKKKNDTTAMLQL